MIAARYTQRYCEGLAAAVLSGPGLRSWQTVDQLLPLDPIPSTPIDPSTLSRDESVGRAYEADELVWHGDFQRPTLQGKIGRASCRERAAECVVGAQPAPRVR